MSRALEAIDAQEIHAEFDGRLRMADGGAFVEDRTSGFFQLFDHWAWGVACCFDDSDAFVYHRLGVAVVVWGHEGGEQGYVDGEGGFGEGAAAADLFAEIVWGWLR